MIFFGIYFDSILRKIVLEIRDKIDYLSYVNIYLIKKVIYIYLLLSYEN